MMETEVAIAMSARDWPDSLRRFLADHGGARVRVAAMGPEDLLDEAYDVLLVDDICSFLTPRLVETVRGHGRGVIGVYDPVEFADGAERLRECGVSAVLACDADTDEFLEVIHHVAAEHTPGPEADSEAVPDQPPGGGARSSILVAVGGPPGGVGATEVAVTLAACLAPRGSTVVLDADENAPSVAQRLGLPLYPNIRTAIDVLEHRSGPIHRALCSLPGHDFTVLPGLATVVDWPEVRARQVIDLVRELGTIHRHVVVNVGSRLDHDGFGTSGRHGVSRAIISEADRLVAVGLATPVGVARLLEWIASASSLRAGRPIDVLVNRAPADAFRRGELLEEITRTFQPASFSFVPEDGRLVVASWNGAVARRGPFRKTLDRWAAQFVPRAA